MENEVAGSFLCFVSLFTGFAFKWIDDLRINSSNKENEPELPEGK